VLAERTLNLLVGYTDWWLTGRYLATDDYKAAMGLMSYILWLIPAIFASLAIGATAVVSRHVGAGDYATARRAAEQSLLAGVVLAAVATALFWPAGPWFVGLMELHGAAADHAVSYLTIILPAIPFVMAEEVAAAALRGAGDTVSGLAAKTVVNVVNVLISTALVTGWGGLVPALGWQGLAIGTAAGHAIGGGILLVLLLRGRAGLQVDVRRMRPDFPLIWRLLRIGLPGGADMAAILFCQFIFVRIINALGTMPAAAHGLGVQIEAIAYLPGSAFQVAAATMAGQYLGAHDPRRAVRGTLMALLVGGLLMTAAGALMFAGAAPLISVFTGDLAEPSSQQAVVLLRIVAVSMPFLAGLMILSGALRGAGDTAWPLAVSLVGFVGVRIPLAYYLAWTHIPLPLLGVELPGLGWGVEGAWYAMVLDLAVRCLLVVARFWQGGWKHVKV
jgi:putative MATE family efflux protein